LLLLSVATLTIDTLARSQSAKSKTIYLSYLNKAVYSLSCALLLEQLKKHHVEKSAGGDALERDHGRALDLLFATDSLGQGDTDRDTDRGKEGESCLKRRRCKTQVCAEKLQNVRVSDLTRPKYLSVM
jgi:hypothetical protein